MDDVDLPSEDSPYLKEFQLAAQQLAELAQHAAEIDEQSVESDVFDSIGVFSVGWVAVSKSEIQSDPKGTLDVGQ